MQTMTNYSFGDIVLVPFPFTDQTTTKKRPAVVVSSASYNTARPDLILMAVSSQMRATAIIGEVSIIGWQKAGLLKPSVGKPVLTTIEKGLVLRQLGQLEKQDRHALQNALRIILG
ncbi:MAG: mRNA interferase MazF [Acidobacteriota bacterium]|nr:mRNA interferase MazF [Acidobacteriota bacterium]